METPSLYLRELNTERYEKVMHSLSDNELMTFFGYTLPEDLQKEKQRHAGGLTMFNKSFLFFHLFHLLRGLYVKFHSKTCRLECGLPAIRRILR